MSPTLVVGKANVSASLFRYLEAQIPEERWVFDRPLDPIFDAANVTAAIGAEEVPGPYTSDVSSFGASLSPKGNQGELEGTQFSIEIVVDQTREANATLRARMIRDKVVRLLRAAARMDDSGPNELQLAPPIFIYNLAADKNATTIEGQIFIPWHEDAWLQEFDDTDKAEPRLCRYRLLVKVLYFCRFDQTFVPASLKPA
jgi:hypothetical protein